MLFYTPVGPTACYQWHPAGPLWAQWTQLSEAIQKKFNLMKRKQLRLLYWKCANQSLNEEFRYQRKTIMES